MPNWSGFAPAFSNLVVIFSTLAASVLHGQLDWLHDMNGVKWCWISLYKNTSEHRSNDERGKELILHLQLVIELQDKTKYYLTIVIKEAQTCWDRMFQNWQFLLGLVWHKRTLVCQAAATGNQSLFSCGPLLKRQKPKTKFYSRGFDEHKI